MRLQILCGLFAFTAPGLLAQQPPAPTTETGNPAMDRAIRRMLDQSPRQQFLTGPFQIETGAANRVCSVPLLEAPIRKDVDFTMKTLQPDAAITTDPFATVRPPAPPCADAPPLLKR